MKKRIVVGLSGGVDSSVAAFLLKKNNYDVIGIFMKNWDDDKCTWLLDSNDAMLVAEQLNIPFQIIDFSQHYNKYIINYIYSEYTVGHTPNPDVLCNKKIKFDIFLKAAQSLGADYIATGHYVIKDSFIKNGSIIYRLISGIDQKKDQSYFLCQLNQYQLSKALFPLGNFTKQQVRKIAYDLGLVTATKKDSQGLCFIGKICIKEFLKKKIPLKNGKIVEILYNHPLYKNETVFNLKKEESLYLLAKKKTYKEQDGQIIGIHDGALFLTKGQRKGIKIGGYQQPIFVLEKDIINNILYVGMGKTHPGLYQKVLFIKEQEVHWIRQDLSLSNGNQMHVYCRIRYKQILQKALLYKVYNGLYIEFENYQNAINEGQFAVWYINNEVIGSGIITNI